MGQQFELAFYYSEKEFNINNIDKILSVFKGFNGNYFNLSMTKPKPEDKKKVCVDVYEPLKELWVEEKNVARVIFDKKNCGVSFILKKDFGAIDFGINFELRRHYNLVDFGKGIKLFTISIFMSRAYFSGLLDNPDSNEYFKSKKFLDFIISIAKNFFESTNPLYGCGGGQDTISDYEQPFEETSKGKITRLCWINFLSKKAVNGSKQLLESEDAKKAWLTKKIANGGLLIIPKYGYPVI